MIVGSSADSSQRGYTLIELLLYITILGSLLGAVAGFYAVTQSTQAKAQVISEVDQQGAMVIEAITHTIRNANGINTPAAGVTSAVASLSMPSAPSNPTIYDVSGTSLRIKQGTATTVLLTSPSVRVTNLAFRNLTRGSTDGALQVSFTLSSTNLSNRSEYSYQKSFTTTVALRQ